MGARKSSVAAELGFVRGGWRDDQWVLVRFIYLMFSQLLQWAVLVAWDSAAKTLEH